MITSWTRSRAPSLVSRCATWVLAVAWEMYRRRAISAFDRPAATRPRTSRSRPVRAWVTWSARADAVAVAGRPLAGAGVLAKALIRRRVTLGASRASPAAT